MYAGVYILYAEQALKSSQAFLEPMEALQTVKCFQCFIIFNFPWIPAA